MNNKRKTNVINVIFFAFVSSSLLIACEESKQSKSDPITRADLIIKNVRIASAEQSQASIPSDVAIINGKIIAIEKAGENILTESDEVIDGSNYFLSPGLIDGHTHLYSIPGMRADQEAKFPEIAQAAREQLPLSYLYFGFTTIVDLNSNSALIQQWNEAALRPQAYFCGAAPIIDGYPTNNIPKPIRYAVTPNYLVEDPASYPDLENFDPEAHTAKAVAENIDASGAICIKTHYESGFGGRGDLPIPSITLIQNLVAEAHLRKLPVLLHANSQEAQQFGLETGVDAIVHGMWSWADNTETELTPGVTTILENIINRKIGWQPTIQVLYGERDLHDPDYLAQAELQHALPQSLIEWYGSDEGRWLQKRVSAAPYIAQHLQSGNWQSIDAEAIQRVKASLSFIAEHKGLLLFGSDTPSDATYANPPGFNGRLEILRWQQSGVSAQQLFEAATINNAKFFGLDDRLGTVEVGKQADLLLLRKNPLLDYDAYDGIEVVIVNGKALSREQLSATYRN